MNDIGQPHPGKEQYDILQELSGPLGPLKVAIHGPSGQRRALKFLRPDLVGDKGFMAWYAAGVTVAGKASEKMALSGLTGPIPGPDGRWLVVQGERHFVQRPYLGSDEHPCYNMNQFLEKYRRDEPGLSERPALAIMAAVACTLTAMHAAQLTIEGEIQKGIPHLNLKPENVLIGRNPRSLAWEVHLTDLVISSASPIAEQAGARAPLNYCHPVVLQDRLYFSFSADVFTCGLLLYRLVEGRDLIPAGMTRQATYEYIRDHLENQVRQLRLSFASGKTKNIMQRCLLPGENERYQSVAELHRDLEALLAGEEPSAILAECTAEKPPAPPPPPPERSWWAYTLMGLMLLLLILLIILAINRCSSPHGARGAVDLHDPEAMYTMLVDNPGPEFHASAELKHDIDRVMP